MGHTKSAATRAKMSAAQAGHRNPNFGKPGPNCKSVTRYTLAGERTGDFASLRLAGAGDPSVGARIGAVCKHRRGSAAGHMWRFSDGAPDALPPHVPSGGERQERSAALSCGRRGRPRHLPQRPGRGTRDGCVDLQYQQRTGGHHSQVQGLLLALRGQRALAEAQEGKIRACIRVMQFVGVLMVDAEPQC